MGKQAFVGLQVLFVAFGALVLVPLITGLNSNTALLTAGIGTLLFQLCTGKQVPIFLASSFAFIAPIQSGVQTWGIPTTMGGLACAGFVYFALSTLVKLRGSAALEECDGRRADAVQDLDQRVVARLIRDPVFAGLKIRKPGVNRAPGFRVHPAEMS